MSVYGRDACPTCGALKMRRAAQCVACYYQSKRDDRPWTEIVTDPINIARFLSRVEDSSDPTRCWLWTGAPVGDGYGAIMFAGRRVLAHRFAHEAFIGPIPDGMGVLHRCDTPICVNPAHLFTGDQQVNMADCAQKFRTGNQKLSAGDVRAIRDSFAGGASQVALSRQWGLSVGTVHRIVRGKRWAFVVT